MQFAKAPLALATALAAIPAHPALAQLAAPAPAGGPQSLAPVVVTGSPLGSDLFSLVAPADVVEGTGLRRKAQPTLGETLGSEVGVSSTYFGPNSSRPIIRGLDGDRIRILQNGAGVIDASAASFDHAVSLDPLVADRVEIVRGPATLMYGGNAVGGVVNVIDGRIAQDGLDKPINGAVDLSYDGGNVGRAGVARLDVGNRDFVLHADVFGRDWKNLKIPGYARSSQLRAIDPRPEADEPKDRLPNSSGSADGGAVGMSFMFGDRGYTGVSYQSYSTEYGTVAEENVRIKLRQDRLDLAGEVRDLSSFAKALRYKLGYSDYEHREIAGGQTGTIFSNKGYDSRIELAHAPIGRLQGSFGLQWTDFRFSAIGEEAFLPQTKTSDAAAFVYEELPIDKLKLSFGARYGKVRVDADDFVDEATGTLISTADRRAFSPLSGSVGAFYTLTPQYGVAANLSYTERAPTYQELYANGPHIATAAFEVGDRTLGKEKSTAFDLALRKQGGWWSGSLGWFYNRFQDYVALVPLVDAATGAALYRDAANRFLPAVTLADAAIAGYAEPLQQYNYGAVPAVFQGFEASGTFRAWESGGRRVEIELRADYTRATNRDTGEALPRIPPLRWGGGVVYTSDRLQARIDALRAERQDKVPEGILPTDGYTMLNASVSYRMRVLGFDWEAFLRASNLLDEEARLATSFLKDIAPLGRRAAMVGLRGSF